MDTFTTDEVFLGLLSVVAQLTALGLVIALVVGKFNARFGAQLRQQLSDLGVGLALAVSFVMMSGSLYLSEVKEYPPCRLCWLQRFAAYPVWLVLLLALLTKREWLRRFVALPLVLMGMAISTYHVLLEKYPERFETATTCSIDNPCSARWIDGLLGYLTIPRMALSGFVLMALLLAFSPKISSKPSAETEVAPDVNDADLGAASLTE
jgi:disulfide bond formation protein DsbB